MLLGSRTRHLAALVAASAAAGLVAVQPATASVGAASTAGATPGSVYVVQGIAGSTVSVSVDGDVVAANATAKQIVGPLRLAPGAHTVAVKGTDGASSVTSTVKVAAGANLDVVVHRQVDPTAAPVITTYRNDLSAVGAGSGRLAVAHVAAVGPADVRVKGKVLFSNIASGEVLTLTVPAGTYPVDIVPTATSGPAVLGPVDLPVAKAALTRVFAIGVAAQGTMDAVVQVLPVSTRGSGTSPGRVDSGDGGQAVALMGARAPERDGAFAIGTAGLLGMALVAGALVLRARRRPAPVTPRSW